MKTRRLIAALGTGVLAAAGGVLALAIPADAATANGVTADCDGLTVDLSGYVAEQPATDAVTHVSYQRYSYNPADEKHGAPANDSDPISDPSHWQANTTDYDGAGHGTDPIGQVFQQGEGNGSYFYWVATTVVDTPAQPAKSNTVTIVIDGTTVDAESFGEIFDYTWTSPDDSVSHTFQVTVSDLTGADGFTFTKTVAATECATTQPTDQPTTPPTDEPTTPTDEPTTTTPVGDPSTAPAADAPAEAAPTPTADSSNPAPVASATANDQLAHTGSDIPAAAIAVPIGAAALGVLAIVLSAVRRRRAGGTRG